MLKNCTLITIQKYDNGQNQINNDMCILAHWYQLQKKKKKSVHSLCIPTPGPWERRNILAFSNSLIQL